MGISFDIVARDAGYYLKETCTEEPAFHGKAAKLLGIEGEFTPEMHLRLFAGQNPHTGERLPGMRNVANRRGAWDVTINYPKWLSLLEQVTGDKRIGDLREKAEWGAMKLIESQARVRVSKKSEVEAGKARMPKGWKHPERRSENIVCCPFRHPSNREGEPHSHTHWLIYNQAYDKAEEQWKTIELRYIDRKGVNDYLHDTMVKGLKKLGYDAERDGLSFKLKSFPREIEEQFSERHQAIKETEAAMQARIGKEMSAKAKGKLSLYNRPEKEYVPIDVRRRGWLSRLSKSQLTSLSGFVKKSRLKVSLVKWQAKLKAHAAKLRVQHTPDKERDHGIGR